MAKKNENAESESIGERKSLKLKQNRQMFYAFIIMALIFVILLIPYFYNIIIKNYINSFEYGGVKFYKSITGDLIFYESDIPLVNNENKILRSYTVRFKTDPRELDNITIDERIEKDGLKFIRDRTVYISINPYMNNCTNNAIALFDFASFLGDSGLTVKPAFTNLSYANWSGYPYVECKDSSRNTVIKIDSGKKTEIIRERTNCYKIVYNECEIIPALEKFNLEIISGYLESINITEEADLENNSSIKNINESEDII